MWIIHQKAWNQMQNAKIVSMRVGEETFAHVDVTADELFQQLQECTVEYPKELMDDTLETGWEHTEREMYEDDVCTSKFRWNLRWMRSFFRRVILMQIKLKSTDFLEWV